MTNDISIISRLKKIALTSIELGREIAREKAQQLSASLRASRAGQLLETAQKRIEEALQGQATTSKSAAPKRSGGKRHIGTAKYSAKTARLSAS
jgi:hypothetical protein